MTDQIDDVTTPIEEVTQKTDVSQNDTTEIKTETSFLDSFTDKEIKSYIEKSGYKDLNGLAKSAMHLEKKLGAPREPEKYTEDQYTYEVPESYQINDDIINSVKAKALENGVKPEAFKSMVETYLNSEIVKQEEELKVSEDSLRKEWGNQYDTRLKASFDTWKSFAGEDQADIIEKLAPSAQIAIAKIMDKVSSSISEGSVGKQNNQVLTKETAQARLDEIYANKDHPYFKGDQKSIEEVFNLQKASI